MKRILLIIISVLCLIACRHNPPTPPNTVVMDTLFTQGRLTCYGPYYIEQGRPQAVYELDLYSADINMDSLGIGNIGTGSNLYFSDVFLNEDLAMMASGEYHMDSTGMAWSWLPGLQYDSNYSGAYVLRIEDGGFSSIQLVSGGHFRVQQEGQQTCIDFQLMLDKKPYHARFEGCLQVIDKR